MDGGDMSWKKALASVGENACVELARAGDMIALRNSRDPDSILTFTRDEIAAFLDGVLAGEFNYLIE